MTSHRRHAPLIAHPALVSLREWLIDAMIGMFFGIIIALVGALVTLWLMALYGTAYGTPW